MSSFKYHTSNKHRYNIYESYVTPVEPKDYYKTFRNTLLIITLLVSFLTISYVSYDTLKRYLNQETSTYVLNKNQIQQINNQITNSEVSKVVSHNIFKKIESKKSLENINNQQLELIIQNVMEKIENSPNKITYTKK